MFLAVTSLIVFAGWAFYKIHLERSRRVDAEFRVAALLTEVERQALEFRSSINRGVDLHVH